MSEHRTLILLRHGKSEYPAGVADHDRPLAARGRRGGTEAGDWIRKHVGEVSHVLCSTATRTRQTLEHAAIDAPVTYLDELYATSHLTYINALREHGGDAGTLLLVGHEPSISATALALTRDRTSKPARVIEEKYPTASVAVLRQSALWNQLETGHSDLRDFFVPK